MRFLTILISFPLLLIGCTSRTAPQSVKCDCPASSAMAPPTVEVRALHEGAAAGYIAAPVRGTTDQLFVSEHPAIDISHITSASLERSPDGTLAVKANLSSEGTRCIRDFSESEMHKKIAILFDGSVVATPTVVAQMNKCFYITGLLELNDACRIVCAVSTRSSQ